MIQITIITFSIIMAFIEVDPPNLSLFLTLTEHEKQINMDYYWPNLICMVKSPIQKTITYLIMPAKQGQLHIYAFEESCLLNKRIFKIAHAIHHRITAVHAECQPTNKGSLAPKQQIFIFLGLQNNIVQVLKLTEVSDSGIGVVKISEAQIFSQKKQPIINIQVFEKTVIVALPYQISFIEGLLDYSRGRKITEKKMPFKEPPTSKLNFQIYPQKERLYIFTQEEGLAIYSYPNLKELGKVQDQIRFLTLLDPILPKDHCALLMGSSDNSIKIVDYANNAAIKFTGLKNFPSCCYLDRENKRFWVGVLDGSIASFAYNPDEKEHNEQFLMYESKLRKVMKICENGLTNILVIGDLMIIKDCEHNVYFYDILKEVLTSQRTQLKTNTNMAEESSRID